MNFNKSIKNLLVEMAAGDLPTDPRIEKSPTHKKAGARYGIKSTSPEAIAAARSKGHVLDTGDVDFNKIDSPKGIVADNFDKLLSRDYSDIQQLTVIVGKIARELRVLIDDLKIDPEAKKINIASRDISLTPEAVAEETQEILKSIENDPENAENIELRNLTRTGEMFKFYKILTSVRGEKNNLTTMQKEAKRNYMALHKSSTPNNWVIFVRNPKTNRPLRFVYGELTKATKWLQETVREDDTPIKFINGAPQYGVQCTNQDLWGKNYSRKQYNTMSELFDVIGYPVIWDVIYAKYRTDAKTFEFPNGETLDLENLKISHYELSEDIETTRGMDVEVARTSKRFAKGAKPLPASSIDDEEVGQETN
jgi:hypothetical protein